jgi:hypothetical protein
MPDPVAPAPPAPPAATAATHAAPAPAAPQTAPPAKPATPQMPARRVEGVTKRSYQTRPANHAVPPAQPAPEVSAAAAPSPPAAAPSRADSAAQPGADKPEDAPAAATDGKPPEPSAKEPDKLSDAEESRRLARIHKAESKLQEQRQAFAREQQHLADTSKKVQIIEQAARAAQQNPLAFLAQLGIAPQAVLDAIISDGSKPEATKLQEKAAQEAEQLRAKLAEVEKTVQDSVSAQQQERHRQSVAAYKSTAIAPVLADKAACELTLRYFGGNEQAAADEVFSLQSQAFALSSAEVKAGKRSEPVVLTPGEALSRIEAHLRSQRDLLNGTSATPAKPQPTARTEPPADKPSGSQATKPAPSGNGIFKHPPKPYTVRSAR